MANFSIIDPQAIENLRSLSPGDNDEFLREIVGIYLEDTPQRIAELDECLVSQNLEKFTRAAHSIKGSSANLGAHTLRAAAERLEHHARKDGFADTAVLIEEIKATFAKVKSELETITLPA